MTHPPQPAIERTDPVSLAPDHLQAPADDDVPRRRCGRCRELFDGDPTLHPLAQAGWWLCPPCRAILLDRTPRPHNPDRGHDDETP